MSIVTTADIANGALSLLALALLYAGYAARTLFPILIDMAKEWLLTKRNARVNAAAETVAVQVLNGTIPNTAAAAVVLNDRLEKTLTTLGNPSLETLQGLVEKGINTSSKVTTTNAV